MNTGILLLFVQRRGKQTLPEKPKIERYLEIHQMTTAQAAVETVETTNTAAAVETPENTTPVNQDLENLNAMFEAPNTTVRDLEPFTKVGLLDENLVFDMCDFATRIQLIASPDSQKAEIATLKIKAEQALKDNKHSDALAIMLEIQELETRQNSEGATIRAKLGEGITFKSVIMAFQEEFIQYVDSQFVQFVKQHRESKLRHKGKGTRSASTGPKEKKKAGPSVVVEYKGEKIEIAKGKGPLPKKLAEVIAAFAKETKVEKVDKSTFITALEANKVKGVKFIESKAGEV